MYGTLDEIDSEEKQSMPVSGTQEEVSNGNEER